MNIQKIKAGRVKIDVNSFIGDKGTIFYDEDIGELRLSDGITPGGTSISTSGGSSNFTLGIASNTNLGGIKVGNGLNITPNGVLSVDPSTIPNTSLTSVAGDIIPADNQVYNLGSLDKQWKSLYISSNTIYFDSIPLSIDPAGGLTINGIIVVSPSGTIAWNSLYDKPNFASVATSGSYNDLINKPGPATSTTLGLVKAGTNTVIDSTGTISVPTGAGINKVIDVPDVYSALLEDKSILVYNSGASRWETSTDVLVPGMDGGEF